MIAIVESKIIDFIYWDSICNANQSMNPRIVQCHGVFDLLHIGHIKHFQAAKNYGDILVVTLTPDRYVNKGPHRPYFTEKLRAEAIAALDCVDYVIINAWPTAIEAIELIKPNVYVKGDEYQNIENDLTGKITEEANAVKEVGGEILFTKAITFSSSSLLNQEFSPYPAEVKSYLMNFKKNYTARNIFHYLEKSKNLKVLVIGEVIIDVYHFINVIGKAGKEPTLVGKHESQETYLGGSLALANHLSSFVKEVTCLTYLGEKSEYQEAIHAGIADNITLAPIYKKNSPTIVKLRYVDSYLRQKLFEVYEINDDFFDETQQGEFSDLLLPLLASHDLVIVADFGHGLLSESSISTIIDKSKYLAVNAQSNAGNHGFNCISKYPKADYVSIATRELQLNYRQRHLSVPEQLERLMFESSYTNVMITAGNNGTYTCQQGGDIQQAPAFASKIVDRVGAGDAVLAITSLCAYQNAPAEVIAFVGNVVGAEAVGIMGNQRPIEKIPLMKHIDHLLK